MMTNKIINGIAAVMLLFLFGCKSKPDSFLTDHNVIPKPQEVLIKEGHFEFNSDTKLYLNKDSKELRNISKQFGELVQKNMGFSPELEISDEIKKNYIVLHLMESTTAGENYTLSISEGGIVIAAQSEKGMFYGMQSVRQLLELDKKGENLKDYRIVPAGIINDFPRFEWRGLMLDESRHFFGMKKVKQILDMMALQKLNKFHWHLTDAPGWRIEIKKYPKLTEIGGIGTHSNAKAKAQFYTQEEIVEIVRYAENRNIEIIPEIDMPGHASAAVRAYPELSGGGSEKHPEFTFHPAKDFTYEFLSNVLREVADLFPSKYIHIGADEVSFGNQQWRNDKAVKALMKREKYTDLKQVERYFLNRMRDSILKLNKEVVGWDEIVENEMDNEKTTSMWWRHDKLDVLYKGMENNYKTVLCPRTPMYFDFVQKEEHTYGRKWAGGFSPIGDVYVFPDLFSTEVSENPLVIGVQANLWTEHLDTEQRLDYMLYPRLSALAESAWTSKNGKSFKDFERRLKNVFEIYDTYNIQYFNYLSPNESLEPGAKLKADWVRNF